MHQRAVADDAGISSSCRKDNPMHQRAVPDDAGISSSCRNDNPMNTGAIECAFASPIDKQPLDADVIKNHPCFSKSAHFNVGRMHLAVAPKCNLGCNFCDRLISDCYHTFRPGVTSSVLDPSAALELVKEKAKGPIRVIGIAGPGEPLFNPETFETLRLVNEAFPDLTLCLSTNGLLLSEHASELKKLGVRTVTVTMNAITPATAAKIYEHVIVGSEILYGFEAAKHILERQKEGLETANDYGLIVKVNTVFIPGVNDKDILGIAHLAKERGAVLHNIIPLIPLAKMSKMRAPTCTELRQMRKRCGEIIEEFYHCKQCRADAVGVPGTER
jgi:nitrogen fixation protein NifB